MSYLESKIVMTGGCQCGAVRYRFEGVPGRSELCHCRMCQKAGGNFGLVLVSLEADNLTWTAENAAEFRSSPIVNRGFCAHCGTPLYMREEGDSHYEITVGSLDNPNVAAPTSAVGIESKWPCFDSLCTLKGIRTDQDRTPEDIAKLVSRQHPDYETPSVFCERNLGQTKAWRPAQPKDNERIIQLCEQLYIEDPNEDSPTNPTSIRWTLKELFANPLRGKALVLEQDGKVEGYALLISYWSNEYGGEICFIDELYVEPDFRSKGFATRLIQELQASPNHLWSGQMVVLMLGTHRTNLRAQALYDRLGFSFEQDKQMKFIIPRNTHRHA